MREINRMGEAGIKFNIAYLFPRFRSLILHGTSAVE